MTAAAASRARARVSRTTAGAPWAQDRPVTRSRRLWTATAAASVLLVAGYGALWYGFEEYFGDIRFDCTIALVCDDAEEHGPFGFLALFVVAPALIVAAVLAAAVLVCRRPCRVARRRCRG